METRYGDTSETADTTHRGLVSTALPPVKGRRSPRGRGTPLRNGGHHGRRWEQRRVRQRGRRDGPQTGAGPLYGPAVTKRQRGYRYPLDDTFFFLSLPPLLGGDGTTGEREDPVAVEGAGGRLVCSDEYMQTSSRRTSVQRYHAARSRMQCHSLGCARIGGGLDCSAVADGRTSTVRLWHTLVKTSPCIA